MGESGTEDKPVVGGDGLVISIKSIRSDIFTLRDDLGAQDVGDIAQPHGTLIEFVIACSKGGEGRLQTLVEGHQTPVKAMS